MKFKVIFLIIALCWGLSSQAQQLSIEKYNIDKVTAKWKNMEARLTIDADYPDGNTPAVRTLQRWLYELFISRHFNGQTITGKQLMERVEANFREANSVEEMKRFAEDGAEEGNWFFNYRVKKEYESNRIASFTYSWDAYQVGNATSSANIIDISVCKTDGRILGWEMFTSVRQLKKVLDKQLVEKFGKEGADLYFAGTPPLPFAPLFLKDGVRFDYGNYSIVAPHVYEETGEYPYAFLKYADILHLLTDEAKALLILSGHSPSLNEPEPASDSQVKVQLFRAYLKNWDNLHNLRKTDDFQLDYAPNVDYYGMKMSKEKVQQSKTAFLQKTPDYEQVSYRLKVTKMDARHVRCDFLKRTIAKGKTRVYPSYLIYVTNNDGSSWQIERESDQVTDKNLEMKFRANEGRDKLAWSMLSAAEIHE